MKVDIHCSERLMDDIVDLADYFGISVSDLILIMIGYEVSKLKGEL